MASRIGERHDRPDRRRRHQQPGLAWSRAIVRTRFSKPLNSRNSTACAPRAAPRAIVSRLAMPRHQFAGSVRQSSSAWFCRPSARSRAKSRAGCSRRREASLCTSLRAVSTARSFLRLDRLAMHRPEPAQPHQLRDPARVVAVPLHRHRLERLTHVPRLQQLDRQTRFPHRRIKPLRQRPRLQPDPASSSPAT